ncbi:hypothetical protein [Propionivibrio sp.]|uniref:hypothetical protein n=1 Tax=Propionivibrio sp. TaxID=2212460 RepID=UPI003BF55D9A
MKFKGDLPTFVLKNVDLPQRGVVPLDPVQAQLASGWVLNQRIKRGECCRSYVGRGCG